MIRVSDKKLLFLGHPGGNTHSIALLPDGNIVTASSTGKILCLFVTPEERDEVEVTPVYKKYELDGGHGVVWDAKRKILWALGSHDLVGYEYVGTKDAPELKEARRDAGQRSRPLSCAGLRRAHDDGEGNQRLRPRDAHV